MTDDFAFHDIPEDAFPFTAYGFRSDTNEKVWEERMEGPGALVVPPISKDEDDVFIHVRIEFANGKVVDTRTSKCPTCHSDHPEKYGEHRPGCATDPCPDDFHSPTNPDATGQHPGEAHG